MKTKVADILYCGVNYKTVDDAKPILNKENLKHLYTWITERYNVHLKKDVRKLKAPWTDNPVVRDYRFTNVRREHDRETIWLIDNISKNLDLTMEEKIINTFLFRTWNKSQTMEILGGPWKIQHLREPDSKEAFRHWVEDYSAKNPKYVWYTNAFNCGGLKHSQKFPDGEGYSRAYREENAKKFGDWEANMPIRMFHIPPQMLKADIINRILKAKDQKEVFELIKEIRGFSDFLGYQVFVDLTYIPEFPFSENEFTIAGPGCKRGLDMVFEDKDGMTYEECLFWLRDNQHDIFKPFGYMSQVLFSDLDHTDRYLNIQSLENTMCEIQKYIKGTTGTGRPRNKYKAPSTEGKLF